MIGEAFDHIVYFKYYLCSLTFWSIRVDLTSNILIQLMCVFNRFKTPHIYNEVCPLFFLSHHAITDGVTFGGFFYSNCLH